MDPITLALMAGGSIIGGINANNANKQNAQIAMMNYYQAQQDKADAQNEARQQRSQQQLGATDAAGNRTYFIPGRGWVTELTDTQQDIQSRSEAEQLRQLSQGARDERVQGRANDRRNREDVLATDREREMRAARREDEGSLRQLLLARGAEQRNRQADRAGDAAARQRVRAGGTNAAELVSSARASADADSARQAGIEAQIAARGMADQNFEAARNPAMLDYFRKMSTSGTGNSNVFQPQGPQQQSTGVQDQALLNIMARGGPEMPYTQPNQAVSGTMSDLASAFGAYRDRKSADKYNQAMIDAWGRGGLGNTGGFS